MVDIPVHAEGLSVAEQRYQAVLDARCRRQA